MSAESAQCVAAGCYHPAQPGFFYCWRCVAILEDDPTPGEPLPMPSVDDLDDEARQPEPPTTPPDPPEAA